MFWLVLFVVVGCFGVSLCGRWLRIVLWCVGALRVCVWVCDFGVGLMLLCRG